MSDYSDLEDYFITKVPIDADSLGSGWQLVHVPARGIHDEPLGFLVKTRQVPVYEVAGLVSYLNEPVSRFRDYDPTIPDSFQKVSKPVSKPISKPVSKPLSPPLRIESKPPVKPARSVSFRHRKEQSSYKDYIPASVPNYDNRHLLRPRPTPPTIPKLDKVSTSKFGQFPRRRRFSEPTIDRTDSKSLRNDMKLKDLDLALLRVDLGTALHSAYSDKISSTVKSKRDYNLAELQRLDRKQDQISKYINDFKRNTVRAKHPKF